MKLGSKMGGVCLRCVLVIGIPGCQESVAPASELVQKDQQVREFWTEFGAIVESGKLELIPRFVQLPMEDTYESSKELIDDFEWVLPPAVQEEIVSTTFDDLKHVSIDSGDYWEFCYHNGLDSEGQYSVAYHIAFVGEKVRVVRILAAG